MPKLPGFPNNPITAIQSAYEEKERTSKRRSRGLGASQLGKQCERQVYYGFRWFQDSDFSGRMLRLFDTGNLQEGRIVDDLRSIGIEVWEKDPNTGKQFRVEHFGGHLSGYMDGIGVGFPQSPEQHHILEFKTHNEENFFKLVGIPYTTKGIKLYKAMLAAGTNFICDLEKGKYEHYVQCQIYMGLRGLDRCVYIGVNKNDDAMVATRVRFNQKDFDNLVMKAERVIFGGYTPPRINENPSWYECKFCDFHDICHLGAAPQMNCRTCVNSEARRNGTWFCKLMQVTLNLEQQAMGCNGYEQIR